MTRVSSPAKAKKQKRRFFASPTQPQNFMASFAEEVKCEAAEVAALKWCPGRRKIRHSLWLVAGIRSLHSSVVLFDDDDEEMFEERQRVTRSISLKCQDVKSLWRKVEVP